MARIGAHEIVAVIDAVHVAQTMRTAEGMPFAHRVIGRAKAKSPAVAAADSNDEGQGERPEPREQAGNRRETHGGLRVRRDGACSGRAVGRVQSSPLGG